jgi:hypothetical protein
MRPCAAKNSQSSKKTSQNSKKTSPERDYAASGTATLSVDQLDDPDAVDVFEVRVLEFADRDDQVAAVTVNDAAPGIRSGRPLESRRSAKAPLPGAFRTSWYRPVSPGMGLTEPASSK